MYHRNWADCIWNTKNDIDVFEMASSKMASPADLETTKREMYCIAYLTIVSWRRRVWHHQLFIFLVIILRIDLWKMNNILQNQNRFIEKNIVEKQIQTFGSKNSASYKVTSLYIAYAFIMANHNTTLARPNDIASMIPFIMYAKVSFFPSCKSMKERN